MFPFEDDNERISRLNKRVYAPRPRPLPIPVARWDEEPFYCLQVNDEWLSHILGALDVLDQADTWQGTHEQIIDARNQVRELIAAFMGDDPMKCCCDDTPQIPIQTIIDPENPYDILVSTDGGVTYHPDPNDPRETSPQMPAPVTSGVFDDKCEAASNCLSHIKEGHEHIKTQASGVATIFQICIDIILGLAALALWIWSLGTIPALIGMIIGMIQAIISFGIEAWDNQFTEDVWDAVLCILYCHMEDDGHFTDAGYGKVMRDCESFIPGGFSITSPAASIQAQIGVIGVNGLNNYASYGVAELQACEDCDCPECERMYDFTTTERFIGVHIKEGTWVSGQGVEITHPRPPFGDFYGLVEFEFDEPCNARYMEVTMHFTTGSALQSFEVATETDENGDYVWTAGGGSWNASNGDSSSGAMIFTPDADPVPRLAFRINLYDGGYQTGGAYLKTVELRNDP